MSSSNPYQPPRTTFDPRAKSTSTVRSFGIAGVRLALLAFWLLAFAATHVPASNLPQTGVSNDKVQHFLAFSLLGFLITAALATLRPWSWKLVLVAIAVAAAYGVADELTQMLVGRTADVKDWLADAAGACAGSSFAGVLCALMARWFRAALAP
jgi:VanZ family protein